MSPEREGISRERERDRESKGEGLNGREGRERQRKPKLGAHSIYSTLNAKLFSPKFRKNMHTR